MNRARSLSPAADDRRTYSVISYESRNGGKAGGIYGLRPSREGYYRDGIYIRTRTGPYETR